MELPSLLTTHHHSHQHPVPPALCVCVCVLLLSYYLDIVCPCVRIFPDNSKPICFTFVYKAPNFEWLMFSVIVSALFLLSLEQITPTLCLWSCFDSSSDFFTLPKAQADIFKAT